MLLFFSLTPNKSYLSLPLLWSQQRNCFKVRGELATRREGTATTFDVLCCVVNALAYSLKFLSNQKTSFCSADEILLLCCCYTDEKRQSLFWHRLARWFGFRLKPVFANVTAGSTNNHIDTFTLVVMVWVLINITKLKMILFQLGSVYLIYYESASR